MNEVEALDSMFLHAPTEYVVKFVDTNSGRASQSHKWPFIPVTGDVINLRNGFKFTVSGRRITYDQILGIEVLGTISPA